MHFEINFTNLKKLKKFPPLAQTLCTFFSEGIGGERGAIEIIIIVIPILIAYNRCKSNICESASGAARSTDRKRSACYHLFHMENESNQHFKLNVLRHVLDIYKF